MIERIRKEIQRLNKLTDNKDIVHTKAIDMFAAYLERLQTDYVSTSIVFQVLETVYMETLLHNDLTSVDLTPIGISKSSIIERINKLILEIDPFLEVNDESSCDTEEHY